jgi:hypothetical protein
MADKKKIKVLDMWDDLILKDLKIRYFRLYLKEKLNDKYISQKLDELEGMILARITELSK